MNKKVIFSSMAAALILGNIAMLAEEPVFLKSSIYSILINSDEQNKRLDKEAATANPNTYAETLKEAKVKEIGSIPKSFFGTIDIPEQFYDNNLGARVIDLDKIVAGMTPEQIKELTPKGATGSGASKFLKSAAAEGVASASGSGESSMVRVDPVDENMYAVTAKYLTSNNVADSIVAKWYNYNPTSSPKFNEDIIVERGFNAATAEDRAKAKANDSYKAELSAKGFDLIDNSFVVATNLRFRNNEAVADEISKMAELAAAAVASKAGGLGGGLGKLAAKGAGAGTKALVNKLMKDQYSVTAISLLYKLDWNDEIDNSLGEKVLYNPNATFDDLLKSGLCKLTYVGKSTARSGVKKDKEKALTDLIKNATSRAMDQAIAKLQVENEVFRTKTPISSCSDGFVYAKIGTREGVAPGDEYEILEVSLDPKTNRQEYKKVGTAKVEKDVWFNTIGADELIAAADDKDKEAMQKAAELGATKFKSSKKGDLTGYILRLAKKKGKIED